MNIFVKFHVEIPQLRKEKSRHAKQDLKWGGMAYRWAKIWAMTIPSTTGERNAFETYRFVFGHDSQKNH